MDTAVLAMTLEPPGLNPTAGAASAVAEITLHNVYETLSRVTSDSLETFQADRRFQVRVGGSRAKTIVAIAALRWQ